MNAAVAGCASQRFATAAMGTRFEIVIEDAGSLESAQIQAVGDAAIAEIERLHRQLSYFSADSLVSHINRTAFALPVRVDAATFALLRDALLVWRASDGAFDITRGAGMDALLLDDASRTVSFARAGVSIDLGGIAKGHAVDRAADILREHGVTSALVHGGTSSVAAIGAPVTEPRGWRIAIASGRSGASTAGSASGGSGTIEFGAPPVWLRDQTLSVSSGALREHIVDPATGRFITGPRTVTVIGPSARLGDAWSTALAVLGARPAALGSEWHTIIEQNHD